MRPVGQPLGHTIVSMSNALPTKRARFWSTALDGIDTDDACGNRLLSKLTAVWNAARCPDVQKRRGEPRRPAPIGLPHHPQVPPGAETDADVTVPPRRDLIWRSIGAATWPAQEGTPL